LPLSSRLPPGRRWAAAIQPASIAGAKLGLHASAYKLLLAKPVRKDVLELIFAVNGGKHVTAVALGSGTSAGYVALNVTPCS